MQTLSYNGRFRFKTTVDTVSAPPGRSTDIINRAVVIIVGNFKVKLFYIPPAINEQRSPYSRQNEFDVLLREVCQPLTVLLTICTRHKILIFFVILELEK